MRFKGLFAQVWLTTVVLMQAAALPVQASSGEKPRKIVLIAGPLDASHPPGTHEYEKSVQLIKYCLDNVRPAPARTEIHFGGWPRNASTLDDADTIVLVSSGSDRKRADHPLLVGDRLQVLERQMKRGCGLVLIHWSTFVPLGKPAEKILEWVGGHFDYESGPPPGGWYSRIKTERVKLVPGTPGHPICRGLTPLELQEEVYYRLRFRPHDPRLTPILRAVIPGEKEVQTVGWAVERKEGGRGFGFTGGHFFANWENEQYRRCLLQAILWTAHVAIPRQGLQSRMPTVPQMSEVFPGEPVTLVPGRFGQALDARHSSVLIPGDERYRWPPLTIECWARLQSSSHRNALVSCDPPGSAHHWAIYSEEKTGAFAAAVAGFEPSEVVSTSPICDDRWHYLAMTFDGTTVTLHVDGKPVERRKVEPRRGMQEQPGPLRIGQDGGARQRSGCAGQIDEVRLSSMVRAITASPEVELPKDERTVGVWRFDQPEGFQGDPDWTPPPLAGKAEPWEKETDVDWIDGRFRLMDTGPYLNHTIAYAQGDKTVTSYKATAIRLDGGAAVLFDRNQLRLAAGWTGGLVKHSNHRFGLLNTPTPAGKPLFATPSGPGWAGPEGQWESPTPSTAPLPREWARFRGLYLNGQQVILSYSVGKSQVLERHESHPLEEGTLFKRTLEIGPSDRPLEMLAGELAGKVLDRKQGKVQLLASQQGKTWTAVALRDAGGEATLVMRERRAVVRLPASRQTRHISVLLSVNTVDDRGKLTEVASRLGQPEDLHSLLKGGPPRWTQPITTRGERALDNAPFVIDTLKLPYDNPYHALLFVSGVDFLPNGNIALCTAHGDVWIVSGVDEGLENLRWKRFATGLYQPLGLRVVNGKVVVIERGQLTRLHDSNDDGEADLYENVNNDWHTGGGEHAFDTCLAVDSKGNYYFFKTGDPHTPTGGCLLRVSADGQRQEIYATGFRHPVGLSVSPDDIVMGADQEGNWMPATRIDVYHKGGFYGDMRTHHRAQAPAIYDAPLCWLPREADNSAGGQVWVPPGMLGPLGGHAVHLSYGRCRALLLLPQIEQDRQQGGAVDLGLFFLSGVMHGKCRPQDGALYVAGLRGWQTAARRDGCLQRVRYTGRPAPLPVQMAVEPGGIRLHFSEQLDLASVGDTRQYHIEQWGYHWSGEYGSKHYSLLHPDRPGHDPVVVQSVKVSSDRQSVLLGLADLRPVMQMKIGYDLKTAHGLPCKGAIYNTINWVPR